MKSEKDNGKAVVTKTKSHSSSAASALPLTMRSHQPLHPATEVTVFVGPYWQKITAKRLGLESTMRETEDKIVIGGFGFALVSVNSSSSPRKGTGTLDDSCRYVARPKELAWFWWS